MVSLENWAAGMTDSGCFSDSDSSHIFPIVTDSENIEVLHTLNIKDVFYFDPAIQGPKLWE